MSERGGSAAFAWVLSIGRWPDVARVVGPKRAILAVAYPSQLSDALLDRKELTTLSISTLIPRLSDSGPTVSSVSRGRGLGHW
jgi:hypothetical protein